jgi:N-dimethylarginine dimethylaminohydrolase
MADLYLMSPPGPRWALRGRANFRSAGAGQVDPKRGLAEWIALADAIEARGGRVVALIPDDDADLTGLPYTAECGQIVARAGDTPLFLLPRMKPEHRRGERVLWRAAAESMGLQCVDVAGIWEAQGDVAVFEGRVLLFHGGRTTEEGARDAARQMGGALGEPLFVEIHEPAFHGNMAVLPLERVARLFVCPEVIAGASMSRLEEAFGRDRLIPVTEGEIRSYGTNGLPIGADILAPHLTPPRVQRILGKLGMNVVVLRMEELCEKAGGASRCLVSHARVPDSSLAVPPALDYRARRAELLRRTA